MKLLIKNGRVIDPDNSIDDVLDVLVEDGYIKSVDKNINIKAEQVIDASGMVVAPGLVDMHVHLRDPGFEYKEDIVSGTYSAVCGGVTSVVCMPNTNPVVDNRAVAEYIINKAKNEGYCNVFPVGAVTKGQKGVELAAMGELKKSGVVAVSDDGLPVKNPVIMRRAMEYAKNFDMPVISHCEDLDLVDGGVMNEGYMSTYLGLRGNPSIAESIAAARDIAIAEYTGARLHIAHVSVKESVEIIRNAKKRGVKVSCETAPHYFSLTDKAVDGYNTNAKMNPPLRGEDDVKAIIEGLADGTIDVIATDHAPHHLDEKNVEFDNALNGIVGLETSLAVAITYLVKEKHLTLNQVIKKMSSNPCRLLGIDRGGCGVGDAADIVIFEPDKEWTVDISKLKSKSKNSPYNGYKLFGAIKHTIVSGKIVI